MDSAFATFYHISNNSTNKNAILINYTYMERADIDKVNRINIFSFKTIINQDILFQIWAFFGKNTFFITSYVYCDTDFTEVNYLL